MQALVVSNEESRRTTYFIKAGEYLGIDTRFITYDELECDLSCFDDVVIKLEPPVYRESGFLAYQKLCMAYVCLLERIALLKKGTNVRFLNQPEAIINSLDKVKSKGQLIDLPTTPLLSSSITRFDELMDLLSKENYSKVFIKPRFGSGADGIMALRYNRRKNEIVGYTTLKRMNSVIYNTKKINRQTNPEEITILADAILNSGALIEKWVLKDSFKNESYDLRVVSQFGKVSHIVVRCSKGAITNLHLNNKALPFDNLQLPYSIQEEIENLCVRAVELSGLSYAGIDVLVEKDTMHPYIIEVNGQGDHIYQDMYSENNIYKKQLVSMITN